MILIDTNVYSALEKGVSSAVDAIKNELNVYLPIHVIGELKHGFVNGNRYEQNSQRLNIFLSQSNTDIFYPTLGTTDVYAQLSMHARKCGRALSNNDVWIAAIAMENDCRFVTFDNDFEVFSELFGDNLLILS